ncbi:hypothetical protein [Pseudothermotoga sp.]
MRTLRSEQKKAKELRDWQKTILQVLEFLIFLSFVWLIQRGFHFDVKIAMYISMALVLLWSARYGLLIFISCLLIFEVSALIVKEIVIEGELRIFTIAVGVTLGIIGETFNRQIRELRNEIEKAELEKNELIQGIDRMKAIIAQLQSRVYFEGEGLIVLLERLKELEILDFDEMLTRSVEVVAQFFELESLSLYRCENKGFLRYVAGIGPKKLPNALEVSRCKVIEDAMEKGYSTLPNVLLTKEISSFEPFFAIVMGEASNPFGVLVVEDVSYEKFSEVLVRYIKAVADWMCANAKIILEQDKIMQLKHKKDDGTWDEVYYLKKREILEQRKRRFNILYEEICLKYKAEVHDEIVRKFRKSDVLFAERENGFVVLKALLPVCDQKGKERLLERLARIHDFETC